MSVPTHADVIVLNRRPGTALSPGDLVLERRPLRKPGPGEVVVQRSQRRRGRHGGPAGQGRRGARGGHRGWEAARRSCCGGAGRGRGARLPRDRVRGAPPRGGGRWHRPVLDNVGGRQLTLALSALKNFGSVVLCGSVSSYARPDDPDARADLRDAVFKRVTLRGFIVSDYNPERLAPVRAELGRLLREAAAGGGQ